jgi:cytochrome b6-f complex iron-sulfur subunit
MMTFDPSESRRRFLRQAATAVGGLALLPTLAVAAEQGQVKDKDKEVVVPLPDSSAHKKVGGSVIVETPDDKIIIAHTGDATYVACSAICTHRGCLVEYQSESQQFFCPCHQSRFALDGKVLRGPARKPLREYSVAPAVVVKDGDKAQNRN